MKYRLTEYGGAFYLKVVDESGSSFAATRHDSRKVERLLELIPRLEISGPQDVVDEANAIIDDLLIR